MIGGLVKILYWCCMAIALMSGIAALTITVAIVTNKLPDSAGLDSSGVLCRGRRRCLDSQYRGSIRSDPSDR